MATTGEANKLQEHQELIEEVDELVSKVCDLRKTQPERIKRLLRDANKKRLNRLTTPINPESITISRRNPINVEEEVKEMDSKLADVEERNRRFAEAQRQNKENRAKLVEQRALLDALHSLINSSFAPVDSKRYLNICDSDMGNSTSEN